MEHKLDIIIDTLNNMKVRLDGVERKIAINSVKLIEIESKLNLRCDDIEDWLNHTVDLNSFEALKVRLNHVEDSIESNNCLLSLNSKCKKFLHPRRYQHQYIV